MKNEGYHVVNIRDYFQEQDGGIGERALEAMLSEFTCPMDLNVETFLKCKAIEFTKKNQSVTFLVFSNDASTLVGYFTIASKPIVVKKDKVSKTIQKKLLRVSEYNSESQTFHLSAYLIAQLGKNFTNSANKNITGRQLLELAIQKIKELQYDLGGVVVFVESRNNEKLLAFYTEQNGFKEFDIRKATSLKGCQLVQLLGVL